MTPFSPVNTSSDIGVADADEDEVGLFGHLLGRSAGDGFFFGSKLLRFARGVGPYSHLMTGARQIARHRIAHETESKKSKLCHNKNGSNPSMLTTIPGI